jgi:L-galactono-1,4-lactone dehydrogenase
MERRNYLLAAGLIASVGGAYYITYSAQKFFLKDSLPPVPTEEHLVNWSGTHDVAVEAFYQPESLPQLEGLVRQAHHKKQKLRCVGSGLSPNGIAFDQEGMVSLALMDKILSIDKEKGLVTVQAGARVEAVADELRRHGLTLQNYASIREQTIGGFTQVSAHGTGAAIPPVDEQVVAMKLVTPGAGTLHLSTENEPELFKLARVGLGCLGIAAEMTLQCVPMHKLVETTMVMSVDEVEKGHAQRLKENKHLRYMWIPGTNQVVVVTNNNLSTSDGDYTNDGNINNISTTTTADNNNGSNEDAAASLKELLLSQKKRTSSSSLSQSEIQSLSATQLRDTLLALNPLDPGWVKKVNIAEAEFWKKSQGRRVGWSDELLGFDCGGQQWVLEVAFPTGGTIDKPGMQDMAYMKELLRLIEKKKVAAPSPIEQRWTAGSSSPMSPAHGAADSVYSWVGIIMYLPDEGEGGETSLFEGKRSKVTEGFKEYAKLVETNLMKRYGCIEHWAKIEVPEGDERGVKAMRERVRRKYGTSVLKAFNEAREKLDPHGVLQQNKLDLILNDS